MSRHRRQQRKRAGKAARVEKMLAWFRNNWTSAVDGMFASAGVCVYSDDIEQPAIKPEWIVMPGARGIEP